MKKIFIAASLVFLTSFGCGVSTEQNRQELSSSKEQTARNDENINHAQYLVKLKLPRGWKEIENTSPSSLEYVSKKEDLHTRVYLLDLDDTPIDATPQNIFEQYVDNFESKKKPKLIEREKTTKRSDKTLTTIVYSGGKNSAKYYYKFTLIEFVQDTTKFLVSVQGSESDKWKKNKKLLEKINRSAKLRLDSESKPTLQEARKEFTSKIVKSDQFDDNPPLSPGDDFELIDYPSPVGELAAYVTTNPNDGKKHPAIIWIVGGDTNAIEDVWTLQDRNNDQSASAFRKAGVVMMFPSQRGGNDNPGQREGFYGEVEDLLAATEYLAKLPYVDPKQIYLGGHSTGGTMAMLVGAYSDRYRGIFALGPSASPAQHGDNYAYFDTNSPNVTREWKLRSPIYWLHSVKNPMYVIAGEQGNFNSLQYLAQRNTNPNIQFFELPDRNHFNYVAPVTEFLAEQIVKGKVKVSERKLKKLR